MTVGQEKIGKLGSGPVLDLGELRRSIHDKQVQHLLQPHAQEFCGNKAGGAKIWIVYRLDKTVSRNKP